MLHPPAMRLVTRSGPTRIPIPRALPTTRRSPRTFLFLLHPTPSRRMRATSSSPSFRENRTAESTIASAASPSTSAMSPAAILTLRRQNPTLLFRKVKSVHTAAATTPALSAKRLSLLRPIAATTSIRSRSPRRLPARRTASVPVPAPTASGAARSRAPLLPITMNSRRLVTMLTTRWKRILQLLPLKTTSICTSPAAAAN